MDDPPAARFDPHLHTLAHDLAAGWTDVRTGLIEALDGVPELWLGRMLAGPLARAGWTVQHEVAHHAADDAMLIALLEHAARGGEAWSAAEARRLRGEAMHLVQRARLARLRDELTASGQRAVDALLAHGAHLDRPFAVGDAAPRAVIDVLRAQSSRARAGVDAVRATFS